MELLRSNLVISNDYAPTVSMPFMEYFNRALIFTQTNYHDILNRVIKQNFYKMTSTFFFSEYVWCVLMHQASHEEASSIFESIQPRLPVLYKGLHDAGNVPQFDIVDEIFGDVVSEKKLLAIYKCAHIINQGIKLFGWDEYKENYLNATAKLCVLPMIGIYGAEKLGQSIGINGISCPTILHTLASKQGFNQPKDLYKAIQKKVPYQLRTIEIILWYAAISFNNDELQP